MYRTISLFLLLLPLSSGIVINLSFLPSLYSLFLILNPLYVHFSLFTSLYLKDSCELSTQSDSLFNDSTLCQNLIMSFFGFNFYGDQSSALVLLFLWILFLNTVSIFIQYLTVIRPRNAVFKVNQSVREIVHHRRDVVVTSTSISENTAAARNHQQTPFEEGAPGDGSDREFMLEESTLSSRDVPRETTEGDVELPKYAQVEEKDDNSFPGLHPDDLSLDLSQPLSDSFTHQQGCELQDSIVSPLGIPLTEYQLTSEHPPFKVYQYLSINQEDSTEDILSVLLAFQVPVTKRDIAIGIDEEAPVIDSITIGVTSPLLDQEGGADETEEERAEIYPLHLLSQISSSSLRTKFNKHQLTLHLTAEPCDSCD